MSRLQKIFYKNSQQKLINPEKLNLFFHCSSFGKDIDNLFNKITNDLEKEGLTFQKVFILKGFLKNFQKDFKAENPSLISNTNLMVSFGDFFTFYKFINSFYINYKKYEILPLFFIYKKKIYSITYLNNLLIFIKQISKVNKNLKDIDILKSYHSSILNSLKFPLIQLALTLKISSSNFLKLLKMGKFNNNKIK